MWIHESGWCKLVPIQSHSALNVVARLLVVMSERQLSESEKVVLQRVFEIVLSSLRGDELGSSSAATPEMESTGRYSREDGAGESTCIHETPRAAYMTTPRVALSRRGARSKCFN